jgi:predicted RNA-binding Zn ribbon-like protein
MDRRPPALFVADALGLDFLNSIATPVDTPVDWIDDGDGLLAWLVQAELVPDDAREAIRAKASPGELNRVADQARNLREWFRGFVRKHAGHPLALEDLTELEPLNHLLAQDEAFTRIALQHGNGPRSLEFQFTRKWRSSQALLLPIAEAMARFVCAEDFSNIKACEGSACTLLFADRTRGRARRWCSMAICGNRAKQAAHRNRLKGHTY